MKFLLLVTMVFGMGVSVGRSQSNDYKGVTFSFKLTRPDSDDACTVFHVGDEIAIRTLLDNQSNSPFTFVVTNDLYTFKYSLKKVGEGLPVAYRDDRAHIISIREEDCGVGRHMELDPILPGKTQELDTMKLSDRYAELSPGRYSLWIEYKTGELMQKGGTPEELRLSSQASFEILP